MDLDNEIYPYCYYRGRATTFERSEVARNSYFGGPGVLTLKGIAHGPVPLHHLASISVGDLGITDSRYGSVIPFYHGMCFECCDLQYKLPVHNIRVASAPYLEITRLEPAQSSDSWPYAGYPRLLPYFPMKVRETMEMPLETFSDSVMQGVDELGDDELVLVVPPNPGMGVSLWGPHGDRSLVQIIWIYDVKKGKMSTYSACT